MTLSQGKGIVNAKITTLNYGKDCNHAGNLCRYAISRYVYLWLQIF